MDKEKIKYYLSMGIIGVLILATVAVTYAYWRGLIEGEGAEITLTLDNINVIFIDETEIAESNARPGWSTTKTFTIENQGDSPFKYDIYIKDYINTLVTEGHLQYKITSTNGYNMENYEALPKSEMASDTDLATNVVVGPNTIQEYTIEIRYVDDPDFDQSEDMGKTFSGNLMIRENTSRGTLYDIILADHPEVKTRGAGDFDEPLGGGEINTDYDTTGVIYIEDTYKEDGLDVYYFAGNPQDNWVSFAGFNWRIIRTNEDGSVRLLYSGERTDEAPYYGTDTQEGYIKDGSTYRFAYSIDNSTSNSTMYVGWTYGTKGSLEKNRGNNPTNQGATKTALDSWYASNINNNNIYSSMVSTDAMYCNDRSSDYYASSGEMFYAAYHRLMRKNKSSSGNQPTFKCGQMTGTKYNTSRSWKAGIVGSMYGDANIADKFSKSTGSGGNGYLTYPVGLMTADEVAFAGGFYGTNNPNAYYYRNSKTCSSADGKDENCSVTGTQYWWLMSPSYYSSGVSWAIAFSIRGSDDSGCLNGTAVHGSNAIRPVLSLKPEVIVTNGTGTATDPYQVTLGE